MRNEDGGSLVIHGGFDDAKRGSPRGSYRSLKDTFVFCADKIAFFPLQTKACGPTLVRLKLTILMRLNIVFAVFILKTGVSDVC